MKIPTSLRNSILACGALAVAAVAALRPGDAKEAPKLKIDDTALAQTQQPAFTFAPVIKRVAPSVVNIYTTTTVRDNPLMDDQFLRGLLGRGRYQNVPQAHHENSLGSGVIVSENGYVLTNNHVIANADEIKVALADNSTIYDAKLVGTDPKTDVAVLKVDAKNLPAITMTDSDRLEVGDVVLALGNPFGLGQTVTMGIVGAKGRSGMGITDYEDFIQTDASINPGNSGGALVDAGGRLVGINTAILSRSGGNQGVGFAVPSNLVRSVMERLVNDGKITRGFLGVMIQSVTPDLAKEFKLPNNEGALVGEVTPKSPAEQAGLKAGDVITEFNGKKVTDSRHLRLMIGQLAPNVSTPLKALREGKVQDFTVKLGDAPAEGLTQAVEPQNGSQQNAGKDAFDGLTVTDLDGRSRRQFDIPAQVHGGALVTDVETGSAAESAGLKAGNVILEINRQTVQNADEAVKLSKDHPSDRVLLRVWAGGSSHFAVLEASRHG